jgi:hypothetical protein
MTVRSLAILVVCDAVCGGEWRGREGFIQSLGFSALHSSRLKMNSTFKS